MSQVVKGTFASGQSINLGLLSDTLVIPTPSNQPAVNASSMKLTLAGVIDASNTCKTQKSVDGGITWADQTTYNSAQTLTNVTVAHGERWRLALVAQQAGKSMDYELSIQS